MHFKNDFSGRALHSAEKRLPINSRISAMFTLQNVMMSIQRMPLLAVLTIALATTVQAADKPLKTFILAGQSNMVGWGDSTKPDDKKMDQGW